MTTEAQPFTVRQSHLATFVRCPLSARFQLEVEATGDHHSPEQARGVMFHRIAAEILRRLKADGDRSIAMGAAFAVMEEVMAQVDMPSEGVLVLGPEQQQEVRIAVAGFAKLRWDTKRLVAIERRLFTTLRGPDGVERQITGQPDAVFAQPPGGAEITDWKTSYQPPKEPRLDTLTDAKRYLSERGMMQLDIYGLLVMDNYPAVRRVSLREIHVMSGEERTATLERDELEEVRERLAIDMMLFDRALSEGEGSPAWSAIGGRWCAWCSGRMRCPRPHEDRAAGAIIDLPMASEYGQDLAKVEAQRAHIIEAAKAWVDAHGPIPLPDGQVLAWDAPPPESAAKAPDAERGTCKWCGDPILRDGKPDRRRQYHGKEGEPGCKELWDRAGGTRQFRVHVPAEQWNGEVW